MFNRNFSVFLQNGFILLKILANIYILTFNWKKPLRLNFSFHFNINYKVYLIGFKFSSFEIERLFLYSCTFRVNAKLLPSPDYLKKNTKNILGNKKSDLTLKLIIQVVYLLSIGFNVTEVIFGFNFLRVVIIIVSIFKHQVL